MNITSEGLRLSFDDGAMITPTTGAEMLDDVVIFLRRFVSLSDAQANIVALWIVHTHCFDAWQVTPYLSVSSAEKRCGKSRLLEVLELLTHSPWKAGRVSVAVLIRKIAQKKPTCLLDEVDAAFHGADDYSEALRGILNCGFQDGTPASLCVGQGSKMELVDFPVFCPKALSGIGDLPDTIADRSIPIRLKRQPRCEKVQRFRLREVRPEAKPIREKVSKWAIGHKNELGQARPMFPLGLNDRQEDVTEPLLAIADLAGAEWPTKGRQGLAEVFGGAEAEDESTGVKLLSDIREILRQREADRISSEELIEALLSIETSPWADWNHGKGLTKGKMARLLHKYEISPKTIRLAESTPKGYQRESFLDAWSRYLAPDSPYTSPENATTPQPAYLLAETHFSETQQKPYVADSKSASNPHEHCIVADVAFSKPNIEKKAGKANGHGTLPSCGNCGSFALYQTATGMECETCGARQQYERCETPHRSGHAPGSY
jgi:hypothetical protein